MVLRGSLAGMRAVFCEWDYTTSDQRGTGYLPAQKQYGYVPMVSDSMMLYPLSRSRKPCGINPAQIFHIHD